MTYRELYENATRKLDKGEITLGEYEEMIKPLEEEVRTWISVGERLPEQETYDDCISRHAVRLIESDSDAYPQEWNNDYETGFTDALNKVLALPLVQPERKKGYWIESHEHTYIGNGVKEWTNWYCSECDAPNDKPADFCPNCGTEMVEQQESEKEQNE